MATYSRVKTFVANETLTASDLNTEFNNIITNTNSGNLNSDNVSTSAAWTWTGYHTYSTSSRIVLADNIYMTLGNATDGDYRLRYNSSNTALELTSTNSDGSGTDAVVMDVQDGTDDVRIRGGLSTDNNAAPISGIVTGGNIVSDTNSTDDLGTTSVRWANLYVDAATITNNLTVGGTLTLTGGLTLNGNVTVGDSASDTLTINSTITSNLLFTDNTYDIGASGATRPRDLFLSRNAVMGGTLGVTGLITATGGVSGALTGNVTGNVTGDVTGDLTGNVTGNVTGNLTGDVTGNISGNVTGGTISGTTGTFSGQITGSNGAHFTREGINLRVENTNTAFTGTAWQMLVTDSATVNQSSANYALALFQTSRPTSSTGHILRVINDGASNVAMSLFDNGDLAVNGDTLFVDASADRVGINTASPQVDFHVDNASTNGVARISTSHTSSYAQLQLVNQSGNYWYQTIVYNDNSYRLYNGSDRLIVDTNGNMGLGVTPSAWHSSYKALQVNDSVLYNDGAGNTFVGSNFYWDGSNYKYINTDYAPAYGQVSGEHRWYTAPSGTAGNTVSFTQAMTLTNAGLLGLGTSSPSTLLELNSSSGPEITLSRDDIGIAVNDVVGGIKFSSNDATTTYGSPPHVGAGIKVKSAGTVGLQNMFFYAGQNNMGYENDTPSMQLAYNGDVVFYNTSPANGMRWDASASSLGIGTDSPSTALHIDGTGGAADGSSYLRISVDGTSEALFGVANNNGNGVAGSIQGDTVIRNDNGNRIIFSSDSGSSIAATIDSSGDLLVGTTSGSGRITAQAAAGNNVAAFKSAGAVTSTRFIRFDINGSTEVGSVTYTGSGTAYNTSSDYRLKENVVGITDGITRIKSLKPSRFNFISNADQTVDGFVAHEVSDIVPEAITGEKDAVDDEGNPQYQGIDQSKLVPLLTAALQEAITKIETLETKVAALEAA